MIVIVPDLSSWYTGGNVVGSTREGGRGGGGGWGRKGRDLRWLGGGSPIRVSRESGAPLWAEAEVTPPQLITPKLGIITDMCKLGGVLAGRGRGQGPSPELPNDRRGRTVKGMESH